MGNKKPRDLSNASGSKEKQFRTSIYITPDMHQKLKELASNLTLDLQNAKTPFAVRRKVNVNDVIYNFIVDGLEAAEARGAISPSQSEGVPLELSKPKVS